MCDSTEMKKKKILDGNKFNRQFTGWRKVVLDDAKQSNVTFLCHVNCILDELPSNICYIIYYHLDKLNVSMNLILDWGNFYH